MATVSTLPLARRQSFALLSEKARTAVAVCCATIALLLLGYHPAAEDGGIYAAAIALKLNPGLFPAERGFATAHTAHSLFVPLVAFTVHLLHLSLPVVLSLAYAASVGLTVAAAQHLLACLFPRKVEQHVALLLFAVSLGLPVAGTSLYLVDPYLTARSFSTPLLILATAHLLQRRTGLFACCLLTAAALHPMMAAWSLPLFGAVIACRDGRPLRDLSLLAAALCLLMCMTRWLGPQDSQALVAASLSREYWFPARWAWYEILGLVAPPALLFWLARHDASKRLEHTRLLATATAAATLLTAGLACLLIDPAAASLLLARLQPLRLMHMVYCIFLLVLAGSIASLHGRWSRHSQWAVAVVAGTSLFCMQRQLYSHSGHLELPGTKPINGYVQAFAWIRENTPQDVLFALDADYTTSPGEDAQLFRAIALRSSLPDAAKDGGISSVVPALAEHWAAASRAQQGLARVTDAERLARVRPLGATWMVLPASSYTLFLCPYRNGWAQVCQLP